MPSRLFYTVTRDDLAGSRDWYVELFGFVVEFDSDWFVQLRSPTNESLEFGIIAQDHDIVPEAIRQSPSGGMLTIVVDDVDEIHDRVLAAGVEVLEPPRDLFYGQRRMLITDPNGLTLDVSSECPPDAEWLAGDREPVGRDVVVGRRCSGRHEKEASPVGIVEAASRLSAFAEADRQRASVFDPDEAAVFTTTGDLPLARARSMGC